MPKIIVAQAVKEPHGGATFRILYLYDISPRIKDALNGDVIPQRSVNIPGDVSGYVSAADKALIDAGDAGFEMMVQKQTASETILQFRDRVLGDLTARQTYWLAQERAKYSLAGTTVVGA